VYRTAGRTELAMVSVSVSVWWSIDTMKLQENGLIRSQDISGADA
jgi:hypothetical protein